MVLINFLSVAITYSLRNTFDKAPPPKGVPYGYSMKKFQRASAIGDSDDKWLIKKITNKDHQILTDLKCTVVLVTNLSRSERRSDHKPDCEDVPSNPVSRRNGDPVDGSGKRIPVTDEEILGIYNREYKVERSFALMKSGLRMNTVYLQKPSRENAMMFVICIGVLLSNIAEAMFRRADTRLEGKSMTMHRLSHELQTTLVMYSRSDNSLSLLGPPEITDRFFEYTDTLGINPQLLFGYRR